MSNSKITLLLAGLGCECRQADFSFCDLSLSSVILPPYLIIVWFLSLLLSTLNESLFSLIFAYLVLTFLLISLLSLVFHSPPLESL